MDHTAVGLRSVVRALSDVVAPAVNREAAQALEQLQLSIDYIEFALARIDLLHDRDRFELRHHLRMAKAAGEIVGPLDSDEARRLATAIDEGSVALAAPDASSDRLRTAAAALGGSIASIVDTSHRWGASLREQLERCVIEHSRERVAFERAWYLPLGFDPDPRSAKPLESMMG